MLNDELFQLISTHTLFSNIDSEIVDQLKNGTCTKVKKYNKNDIIARQGQTCKSLLILCRGSVNAQMINQEGKEFVVERLTAPELLAPAFIYATTNVFPIYIIAQEECELVSIDRQCWLKLMQQSSELLHQFLKEISDRSQFLSKKLHEFALQSLQERILGYLKRHQRIDSIQETAFILGVARPSLSRALANMVEQSILVKVENAYSLKN